LNFYKKEKLILRIRLKGNYTEATFSITNLIQVKWLFLLYLPQGENLSDRFYYCKRSGTCRWIHKRFNDIKKYRNNKQEEGIGHGTRWGEYVVAIDHLFIDRRKKKKNQFRRLHMKKL